MCLLTSKLTPKKHILASHPVIVKTTTGLVSWWNEQHLVPRACNLCGKCRPPHSRCVKESFTEKRFGSPYRVEPKRFHIKSKLYMGDLGINAPIACPTCHLMKLPQLRESSVTTCRSHKCTETIKPYDMPIVQGLDPYWAQFIRLITVAYPAFVFVYAGHIMVPQTKVGWCWNLL